MMPIMLRCGPVDFFDGQIAKGRSAPLGIVEAFSNDGRDEAFRLHRSKIFQKTIDTLIQDFHSAIHHTHLCIDE